MEKVNLIIGMPVYVGETIQQAMYYGNLRYYRGKGFCSYEDKQGLNKWKYLIPANYVEYKGIRTYGTSTNTEVYKYKCELTAKECERYNADNINDLPPISEWWTPIEDDLLMNIKH